MWARLHLATGITRPQFDDLEADELHDLLDEVRFQDRRQQHRDADLKALLCNLLAHGKKTWQPEDFLPKPGPAQDSEEAKIALANYEAAMSSS